MIGTVSGVIASGLSYIICWLCNVDNDILYLMTLFTSLTADQQALFFDQIVPNRLLIDREVPSMLQECLDIYGCDPETNIEREFLNNIMAMNVPSRHAAVTVGEEFCNMIVEHDQADATVPRLADLNDSIVKDKKNMNILTYTMCAIVGIPIVAALYLYAPYILI